MFIILLIGAFCYMKGLITKEGTKQLSAVELNLVNPILIFMSYQKDYESDMAYNLLWAFILSALSYAVAIALSYLLVSKKQKAFSIERFSIIYSNCGFIGIPLINGLFGAEGVLYLTAYVTFFNFLVWTHGLMTMKEKIDFSSALKALKAPSVIAIFLGLVCYFTRLHLPSIPAQALQYISDMNTPLAMIIAGATAAQTNILSVFRKPRNYLICFYKLLAIPLIAFLVIRLFNVPPIVCTTLTVATACPVATTGIMFAITLDKDSEKCSELFTMSTLLSALTLPLVTVIATTFS
ncbi:MAG: AEC family transporter [Ruminococcus sp.]|nr:AEC family transporter [Ruminococcus sp.]